MVENGDITPSTNRFAAGLTYDDAGNVAVHSKFRNFSLQYDANSRPKQSSDGSTTVVSLYDVGGQRVVTQVSGALTNVLVYDCARLAVIIPDFAVGDPDIYILFEVAFIPIEWISLTRDVSTGENKAVHEKNFGTPDEVREFSQTIKAPADTKSDRELFWE